MITDKTTECPICKASWDGGSILDSFKKQRDEGAECYQGKTDEDLEAMIKECYRPPYRWSRLIGIEDRDKYDGISFWQCPDCKTTWNRFTGKCQMLHLNEPIQ